MGRVKVPNAPTIRRMPSYLHKLYRMLEEGKKYVSCTDLAKYMDMEPIVARKDIAMTGLPGHRRHGYVIVDLIHAIRDYIGWNEPIEATLVGAGSLGTAILGFGEFSTYGLNITTVFDSDAQKIGRELRGHVVLDVEDMEEEFKGHTPKIAIICVNASQAQSVADKLVKLGVHYIWNFANISLTVPENVVVQREVIAGGFAMLASKIKNVENGGAAQIVE